MKILRRILGILVMIAGLLGLLLSLAGLVGVWMAKPTVASTLTSTMQTLDDSIETSQKVMQIAGEALGATVESVDALSEMLGATATSVGDTRPVTDQITDFMGENLPDTLKSASDSLHTAQQAAIVLDSSIRSLETFRAVLSTVPLVGGFVEIPAETYNPEVPLAQSLGDVADNLDRLPAMFTEMSENMDKATANLETIQKDLDTMSTGVGQISKSLGEYQAMLTQSQSSMDNVKAMIASIQANLNNILNSAALVLSLFLVWLLVAQIVILTQGYELYQGTAGRMESGESLPHAPEPAPAAGD